MRRSKLVVSCLLGMCCLLAFEAAGQVVAPVEIKDPELRGLQSKYMDDLKAAGAEINNLPFEYPFYLSRKLDLDEQQQKSADQRSLRFEHYNGKTVVAISGNYYAAYSTQHLGKDQRARATFLNVCLPILKTVVPKFQNNPDVQGYALEISHHILGKVMGVAMERPENLMIFLPQASALKLLNAKNDAAEQAALLGSQFFVNAEPVSIWINGEEPQVAASADPVPDTPAESDPPSVVSGEMPGTAGRSAPPLPVPSFPKRTKLAPDTPPPATPPRDTSPEAVASAEAANKDAVTKLVKELDPQAHFVSYTEPSFIVFRDVIYMELSINTTLPDSAGGSRYRLAANAFDDHIAHLIRPVLGYFKEDPKQAPKFDGIGFSTTIHVAATKAQAPVSEAVEFFFPFPALRCYEKFDCTGQQLLDAGTVLINGERVSLDLQIAEGAGR